LEEQTNGKKSFGVKGSKKTEICRKGIQTLQHLRKAARDFAQVWHMSHLLPRVGLSRANSRRKKSKLVKVNQIFS
jgi:hypothetical protein